MSTVLGLEQKESEAVCNLSRETSNALVKYKRFLWLSLGFGLLYHVYAYWLDQVLWRLQELSRLGPLFFTGRVLDGIAHEHRDWKKNSNYFWARIGNMYPMYATELAFGLANAC